MLGTPHELTKSPPRCETERVISREGKSPLSDPVRGEWRSSTQLPGSSSFLMTVSLSADTLIDVDAVDSFCDCSLACCARGRPPALASEMLAEVFDDTISVAGTRVQRATRKDHCLAVLPASSGTCEARPLRPSRNCQDASKCALPDGKPLTAFNAGQSS